MWSNINSIVCETMHADNAYNHRIETTIYWVGVPFTRLSMQDSIFLTYRSNPMFYDLCPKNMPKAVGATPRWWEGWPAWTAKPMLSAWKSTSKCPVLEMFNCCFIIAATVRWREKAWHGGQNHVCPKQKHITKRYPKLFSKCFVVISCCHTPVTRNGLAWSTKPCPPYKKNIPK